MWLLALKGWFGALMPLCAKCKSWVTHPGDSWCIGCTAASELALELQRTWAAPVRRIAHDIVIGATRQVKALRSFGAGLHSRARSEAAKGSEPDPSVTSSRGALQAGALQEDLRTEIPRRRTTTPKSAPRSPQVKGESPSESSDSCEPEEPEDRRKRSPPPDSPRRPLEKDSHHRKPPEPDYPPPGQDTRKRSRERRDQREGQRPRLVERSDRTRDQNKAPRRKHRAGRKHQRLYRLAIDPTTLVHQRQPEAFWALEEDRDAPSQQQC